VIDDAQRLVGFAFVVVDFAADLGVPRNDLTGGGNRFVPAVADPDAGFVVGGESPPLAIARLLRASDRKTAYWPSRINSVQCAGFRFGS
jgi:hypothetical protein